MLPRLIVVADGFTDPSVRDRCLLAAEAGAPWILLRDRAAPSSQVERAAADVLESLSRQGLDARISVTAHVDVALRLGVGIHLGARDAPVADVRANDANDVLIGYSAHTVDEARTMSSAVSYLVLSPVFATEHRPGVQPLGLHTLKECASGVAPHPVYALGGIRPEDGPSCLRAGAHGIAVLSGIMNATDVRKAVHDYLRYLS